MGLSIIGTGKRFFPSSKLPQCSPSLLLIDYPEVQRPGHEPEVRNEWSGASTPLIHLHVGPRDSAFARMGQYVSPGVHVGRYKLGVTRIYMYKGRTLRRVCFMKYWPRGSGSIAADIINLVTRWRWLASFTPWPLHLRRKTSQYPWSSMITQLALLLFCHCDDWTTLTQDAGMPKSSHKIYQACVWSVKNIVDILIIVWGQRTCNLRVFFTNSSLE